MKHSRIKGGLGLIFTDKLHHMRVRQRNKLIYTLLLLFFIVLFWAIDNFYTPEFISETNDTAVVSIFPEELRPTSTTENIITHRHFILSYSERYEQAEWVAYVLKKDHLTYDDRERPYFIEDPKVKTKSADWRNYKNSGYDRGHLCPAGDRRFSEFAYDETFYTSNISPMKSDFNAGVWNRLEKLIRKWGKEYRTMYVITGGILEEGLAAIGEEDVAVPRAFYKIVARGASDNLEVVTFLIPHRETQQSLSTFLISVDELEMRTGIDYFSTLPEDYEQKLEASVKKGAWKF